MSDYIGPNRQFKDLAFSLTSMRRFWMILNRVTMRPDLSFELGNSFFPQWYKLGRWMWHSCGKGTTLCSTQREGSLKLLRKTANATMPRTHIKLDVKYEQIT